MRFEWPSTKWKVVDVEKTPLYTHRTTIITRRPWIRIIWNENQRTIMIGKRRFSTETVDPNHHMEYVAKSGQEWWEK